MSSDSLGSNFRGFGGGGGRGYVHSLVFSISLFTILTLFHFFVLSKLYTGALPGRASSLLGNDLHVVMTRLADGSLSFKA